MALDIALGVMILLGAVRAGSAGSSSRRSGSAVWSGASTRRGRFATSSGPRSPPT